MSDSVMYPEAGRWVNSYLVGANAYKIMSTPEEAQQLLLDDSGDFLQTGTEHHYIQVRCRNENKPLWLVPFRVKQEELLRVSDVLEQIQMGRILREGFFWPFDLVRSDEMQGYVLHPFSMDAYPSVRRFLPSSDTPRWTIAVHLFRRIGQLHREGLTLNGFGRDQVRVEYGTNQVYLVPGETISRVSQIGAAFRGDFLSVPQVVEQQLEKNGIVLDGRVRDIFSAAVIAFYLLFYTHPFIGEEYSHLMREQYLEYFQSRPVFLFDAGGHNGTGHHQFGAEITAQWWRAQPELRQLVREYTDRYAREEIDGYQEKSARFRYLFSRLRTAAYAIVEDMAGELAQSDFSPVAFELGFGGKDGQLPAVTITEGDQRLSVSGKVDRVDGWLHDGRLYLRVVDYKSGRKSFDLANVRMGLDIQMLLYLFTLQKEGAHYFGQEIEPAGVLYLPARDEILSLERNVTPEQLLREREKTLKRSGLLLAEPAVLSAMEHDALTEPHYLPLRVNRSGDISGSIASAAQLGRLGNYVDKLLRQISHELRSGNIDADPCCHSEEDSQCRYCDWAPACHFRDGQDRDHLRYILPVKPEEFWKELEEGDDDRWQS